MHCAIPWNCDWFRVYPIASDHLINVCRCRCRHERALFSAQRAARLDEILAAARSLDGPRETVHGFPPARDVALPDLRARCPTRTRRRDLGELLLVDHRDRL